MPTETLHHAPGCCSLHRAAPELLEALKAVVQWRNGPEAPYVLFEQGAKMLRQVQAAIRKAEGDA